MHYYNMYNFKNNIFMNQHTDIFINVKDSKKYNLNYILK